MRRVLNLILLLGTLTIFRPATGQHPLIISGDREAERGNYSTAVTYYTDAFEKFPYNYMLFKKLGESYRLSGAFEEALGWYEKCMITGKFSREDSCRHAELLLMNGRIEKAASAFEELLRTSPGDPEVIRMLGCCRFAASELAKSGIPPVTNCEKLNSPRNESGLSFNGEGLIFSSNRPGRDFLTVDDISASGGTDFYLARRNEKTNDFERPGRIPGKLNSPWNETGFSMSQMSQMSFISRTEPITGKCRIYSAKRIKNQWTDVTQVSLGNDAFNSEHPALSSDGLTLWFISDMPGGLGGKDLWKAPVTTTGETGTPVNAGPAINSIGNEDYPSLWGDTLLIFSSDGHTGMGGMDIYYCRLEENEAGMPVNAGAPVNSTFDDYSIWLETGSGGGLFCSNRTAGQGDDIFRFSHSFVSPERIQEISFDNVDNRDTKDNNLSTQKMFQSQPVAATATMKDVSPEVLPVGEPIQLPAVTETISENDTTLILSQKAEISGEPVDLPVPAGNMVFYRIQIAAAVKPITSFGQFSKLSDLIDFYGLSVDKAGIHYKYRIGNFDSRVAALPVWQKIRDRGFRDCFIVPVE